jgi:hypothetical protein
MDKIRSFSYWPLFTSIFAILAVFLFGDYIDGRSGYFMGAIGLSVGYVIGQVNGMRMGNKEAKEFKS